jgi:hypothetical protein
MHISSKHFIMKSVYLCLSLVTGATLLFTSCKKEISPINEADAAISSKANQSLKFNTFKGPEVEVGEGYARSFIVLSHTGVPQELGVMLTDEALEGLPTVNTPYVLELHHKAVEATPFEHIAMGWSANGHPLPGTFIGPHFDVRFFMLTLAERLAIPAPPAPSLFVLPPTGYMPVDYFADVPGPQLGMHWTDKTFSNPVTHEMILGSYNGMFTFVSPIVLRTELQGGQSFSLPYSQPQLFAEHGYYPTVYNIYEDGKQNHYVSLSAFVWR